MFDEKAIIEGCIKGKASCQEALYKHFSRKMMGICVRYAATRFEAEDVFHEAFVKVFNHIQTYKGGSFEAWMKRIFITTAINNYYKHKKHYHYSEYDEAGGTSAEPELILSNISNDELIEMINALPEGYKMVFNLYVIEGYQHKEIAQMLNITEGTSKSQLNKAKSLLKKRLAKLYPSLYEDR